MLRKQNQSVCCVCYERGNTRIDDDENITHDSIVDELLQCCVLGEIFQQRLYAHVLMIGSLEEVKESILTADKSDGNFVIKNYL